MSGSDPVTVLHGRTDEQATIDALLDAIRRGESRSLVLRGEAGIGKSALLEYLIASASDLTIARAVGVESEMELAYASLHQLCTQLPDRLESLPAPQRDALRVAFGLTAGPPPDRFLVGLAALGLLSEVAHERPLLCVIDDAQWLDRVSALTLAFVARRLQAEPVGVVFGAREPGDELQHLPTLDLRGLRNGDARQLLGSAVSYTLDPQVRDRILAETHGNPLALLELPRGLTETQLAGGLWLAGTLPVPARIEQTFVRRVDSLSDDARRLLLVAAAEPLGDPVLLWRAAEVLQIGSEAADEVRTTGLLAIDQRVVFRHPLVRSAVYGSAAAPDRRAVHLALADVTDREVDPDRRAWHLAAAAAGPDEEVALELERSAARAQARGGFAAAGALLQRAVALTDDLHRRGDRALAAGAAAFQAGVFDVALRLVATAEAGPIDERQRAQVDLLRGSIAFASGFGSDAAPLLLKAAKRLERFDAELARETYLTAWCAAAVSPGDIAGGGVIQEISRTVLELPRRPGAPRPLDLLLDGLALLVVEGRASAIPTLQRAASVLVDIPAKDVLGWGWMAVAANNAAWDNDGAYEVSARQVQLVRDAGALARLPLFLSARGLARAWSGDLAGAGSDMAEADSVASATGSVNAPWTTLRLLALRGRQADLATVTAGASAQARGGAENAVAWGHWAAAVLYIGLGRYEEAVAAARQVPDQPFEFVYPWVLPELVEGCVRSGDPAGARDALSRLAETTQASATDLALGIETRSRALLSDGENADDLYREAIDRLGRTQVRPELARAHLLHGEWLRRERRRLEARESLRLAHGMFMDMGMEAFAGRAARELQATGETTKKRVTETRDDLTAQEMQIARFARDGLSNPEIGARLFISPRTVEYHLHKVFAKLGIPGRAHLNRVL